MLKLDIFMRNKHKVKPICGELNSGNANPVTA